MMCKKDTVSLVCVIKPENFSVGAETSFCIREILKLTFVKYLH
nr:MAG TPA: hypothetical protein [Caudoviricetes sp.]